MKKFLRFLPAALALVLTAGCGPSKAALSPAAIPVNSDADEGKYIAITFDDGPRADTTARLLDGLLERDAKVTFFIIGEQIPGCEDLLRRMKDEGHQIGNHTYTHVRLLRMDDDAIVEEIHKTEVLLEEVVGEGSFWLRPPYGQIDARRAGLIKTPMIYWSVDPQDWKLLDKDKVVREVLDSAGPGDIVLLHDFYSSSVDAALEIIDRLQAEGYSFVTVEELFALQGVEPRSGTLYASPEKIRPLS